jgi:AGZA family xanthine/uracil permease-like MFS transporter
MVGLEDSAHPTFSSFCETIKRGTGMNRYVWSTWGDVNAFFGLMLDNVTVMLILATLLGASPSLDERFTLEFVLTRMIPGTALGVLIGDLIYTWMAFRLAKRTGRADVTAMPLGLDTPSTFGVVFFVLLPALREGHELYHDHEQAMTYAWHVGALALVLVGVFKSILAPLGNKVRQWVPRAGLLGSLAAIAIALIAGLPFLDKIAAVPVVGFLCLMVILVTLVAHRTLPGKIPGALAAVVIGAILYHSADWLGRSQGWNLVPEHHSLAAGFVETPLLMPILDWSDVWQPTLLKLPVVLPFALITVVGGIDCTESAAAAGDEYDTRTILLTEGIASLAAGVFGGVIQNTPYIGQPAYKAMGGRASYTLATALFVGAAGCFGWFTRVFDWFPQVVMYPILVYVGLEIMAQSFRATPVNHYPALALAMLPALAALATILLDQILGNNVPSPGGAALAQTLRCVSNGFIVTSLLWGAALAALIDGRLKRSAAYLGIAGLGALFGIIHSPLRSQPIDFPWHILPDIGKEARFQTPYHWAAGYGLAVAFLLLLDILPASKKPNQEERPEPKVAQV